MCVRSVRPSAPQLDGVVPYDPKYLPAPVMISANENPNNLPEEVIQAIRSRIEALPFNRYSDPLAKGLRDRIASLYGLACENVLLGNGGDELLFDISLAWGGPGRTALDLPPTFSVYAMNARLLGTNMVSVPRREDYSIDEDAVLDRVAQGDIDYLFVTSPNNPTGGCASEDFLLRLLDASDALVVVDEAYAEFAAGRQSAARLVSEHANLLVLRTFSKAYACAGVRLGYVLGDAATIRELIKVRQPYSVDAVSQVIGEEVLDHRELFEPGIARLIEQRGWLAQALSDIDGVSVYPSDANFLLIKLDDAGSIWQRLFDEGVLVRDFSSAPYLENCLRITVGTEEENRRCVETLRRLLGRKGVSQAS